VACVDVTFWYLSGDTKENHKTISIIGVAVQNEPDTSRSDTA
jgi:hypothetical protein